MNGKMTSTKKTISKRVTRACDCCRKSKTKCDGKRPCTRCLSDNKICTYVTSKTPKGKKLYSSQYVDLLETRVSILVQSLERVIELSTTDGALTNLLSERELYNEDGEVLVNKVVCRLMSFEKLENLSKSGSLEDIVNVSGDPSPHSSPMEIDTTSLDNVGTTPVLSSSPIDEFSPALLNTPFGRPEFSQLSSSSSSFSSISSASSSNVLQPQILFGPDQYSTLITNQSAGFDNNTSFMGKAEFTNDDTVLEWPEVEPNFELYR